MVVQRVISCLFLVISLVYLVSVKGADIPDERYYSNPTISLSRHPKCATGDAEGDCACADTVVAALSLGPRKQLLHLTLNRNVQGHKVPITILSDGGSYEWKEEKEKPICMYYERSTLASIAVNQIGGDIYLDGSFRSEANTYVIRQLSQTQRRLRRATPSRGRDATHLIYRINKEGAVHEDLPVSNSRRHKRANDPLYKIALAVVVDYYLFEWWKAEVNSPSESQRRIGAINKINYYFTHVVNRIDMFYMDIKGRADYGLSVVLSSFYIAESAQDSPWTNGAQNNEIDASTALNAFQDWFGIQPVRYDHAVLVTSLNMFSPGSNNGDSHSIIGKTRTNSMCSDESVSVCEHGDLYQVSITLAHEIGHSLASGHDGDGNACPPTAQNIMAPRLDHRVSDNYMNYGRFSECSINSFRDFINNLGSNNCLTDPAAVWDTNEWDTHLAKPPGQEYDLDFQCHLARTGSKFCGLTSDYGRHTICPYLRCYDPEDSSVCLSLNVPALVSTSCGNKMWCENGQCVANSRAPGISNENCMAEYQGSIRTNRGTYTCPGLIAAAGRLVCYEPKILVDCCETCAREKDGSSPGCPFGDKNVNCDLMKCENPANHGSCCETCKDWTPGRPPYFPSTPRRPVFGASTRPSSIYALTLSSLLFWLVFYSQ